MVYDPPSKNRFPGVRRAPGFESRALLNGADVRTNHYDYLSGCYDDLVALDSSTSLPTEKILGIPTFWRRSNVHSRRTSLPDVIGKRIGAMLHSRQDPFVVLDIGGGSGDSIRSLSKTYAEEVNDSRIAFAVSNLQYDLNRYPYGGRIRKRFINTGEAGNVHFISSAFGQLIDNSVTLANGEAISLTRVSHLA